MQHPGDEKLEKYLSRGLSAHEMTELILHIDECPACGEKVLMFANRKENATVGLEEAGAGAFHLDYDEHLLPFVEHDADAVTRELVETHTLSCAACALELRELREFSESLKLREIEKHSGEKVPAATRLRFFLASFRHKFALPVVAVMVFVVIVATLWLALEPNRPNQRADVSGSDSNTLAPSEARIEPPLNTAVPSATSSASPAVNQVGNEETAESPVDADLPKSGPHVDVLSELPAEFREMVAAAKNSGRVIVPRELEEFAARIKPRGPTSAESAIVSPNREFVIENRPVFSWKAPLEKNVSFVVEIFDENNDPVMRSPMLSNLRWKPVKSLRGDRSYNWEVRLVKTDASSQTALGNGQFRILGNDEKAKLRRLGTATPLDRGLVLASVGLIDEARREFAKAARLSPRGPAGRFIKQLERFR